MLLRSSQGPRIVFATLRRAWLAIASVGVLLALYAPLAQAQITNTAAYERLRQDTIRDVRSTLEPLVNRYCYESCELISIKADLEEEMVDIDDLGFEGISDRSDKIQYYVSKVSAELQIDDRISIANRARLDSIFVNHMKAFAHSASLSWRPVSIPSIGSGAVDDRTLKSQLESRINEALMKVIRTYCPDQCMLAQIHVEGTLITPDDANSLPPNQVLSDQSGRTLMRVDGVRAEVTMDSGLDEAARDRILSVMRAKVRFVDPVFINAVITPFPEPYAQKQERLQQESQDPYGLEKLRRMLEIFRDLAGTKEIISSTTTSERSDAKVESAKVESASASVSENVTESSKDRRLDSTATQQVGGASEMEWIWIILAALTALIVVAGVVMRLASANRDAKVMMQGADQAQRAGPPPQIYPMPMMAGGGAGAGSASGTTSELSVRHSLEAGKSSTNKEMMQRLKIEKIRSDLVAAFIENPKLARETFGRMLKETGIEETSKYVHILGQLVVFNLLDDPNLQRELYELSEYYHNSHFEMNDADELRLLESLKTKVTAAEIKLLSLRATDKFDFLAKLDAEQIYKLISEENSKVQSIVLTQLEKKRRIAVFAMYQGRSKIDLMNELSRADAIPKEYLNNVANALVKKIMSRPEFDTTNLRASDILLDLLERANLDEQRRLMRSLQKRNPETARSIKMRLMTIEMLPFLKDGHLLELILGMERDDLLTFLMGTPDHIRSLLLNKAPGELASSWAEDLHYMASVDEQNYRLVEMKVMAKVRSLANNGAISILDINDMIFADHGGGYDRDEEGEDIEPSTELDVNTMVA